MTRYFSVGVTRPPGDGWVSDSGHAQEALPRILWSLTVSDVTSSRNPVLSALLQEVQLPDSDRVICENRGTGIPTMLEQLRRSGTASVRFSNAISHFTVTFTHVERNDFRGEVQGHGKAHPGPPVTGRPAEILALFADQPELTASDVAQATGLSRAMTQRHLARLVEEGRLVPTAPPSSRNRAYRLPPGAGVPPQYQGTPPYGC